MEKMVTRTIEMSEVTFMTVDTTSATLANRTELLSGSHDTESAMKYARKYLETDTVKFVSVVSIQSQETLYGMSEREFMKYAKVLPPRKVYTTETE